MARGAGLLERAGSWRADPTRQGPGLHDGPCQRFRGPVGGGLPLAGCTKLALDGESLLGNKAARQADGRGLQRRCFSAASMVACKTFHLPSNASSAGHDEMAAGSATNPSPRAVCTSRALIRSARTTNPGLNSDRFRCTRSAGLAKLPPGISWQRPSRRMEWKDGSQMSADEA